jgi:hypothetical protein
MQKINKKLQLNKEIISELDNMDKIYGGEASNLTSPPCLSVTLPFCPTMAACTISICPAINER